jgi:hypothetical protein
MPEIKYGTTNSHVFSRAYTLDIGRPFIKGDKAAYIRKLAFDTQDKIKSQVGLREEWIPNRRVNARCNIFVSPGFQRASRVLVFLQPGKCTFLH